MLSAVPESFWERRTVMLVSVTVTVPPSAPKKGIDWIARSKPSSRKASEAASCADEAISAWSARRSSHGTGLAGLWSAGLAFGRRRPRDRRLCDSARTSLKHASGTGSFGCCCVQNTPGLFLTAQDIADRINVEVGLLPGGHRLLGPSSLRVWSKSTFLPAMRKAGPGLLSRSFFDCLLVCRSNSPPGVGPPKSILSEPRR